METSRLRRVAQYEKDRLEALQDLDPVAWSVFCLRWGINEPEDDTQALLVMHKVRVAIEGVPDEQKAVSTAWLAALPVQQPPDTK